MALAAALLLSVAASAPRGESSASPEAAPAPPASPTPVLVELFTSEGCSSCPPAEAVLERLSREQPVAGARIVLLSQHVSYWDRLGWKDRFSSAAATARQEAYGDRLGRGSIYTPQAVVDGAAEVVGSSRAGLLRLVEEAARRPKGSVRFRTLAGDRLAVEARWDPGVPGEVFAAAVIPRAETEVRAGENAGRRLVHASVVRLQWKLGAGRGGLDVELARPRVPPEAGVLVAWVQEAGGGRVLAVGEGSFRADPVEPGR
jgi:hypothetical protein